MHSGPSQMLRVRIGAMPKSAHNEPLFNLVTWARRAPGRDQFSRFSVAHVVRRLLTRLRRHRLARISVDSKSNFPEIQIVASWQVGALHWASCRNLGPVAARRRRYV